MLECRIQAAPTVFRAPHAWDCRCACNRNRRTMSPSPGETWPSGRSAYWQAESDRPVRDRSSAAEFQISQVTSGESIFPVDVDRGNLLGVAFPLRKATRANVDGRYLQEKCSEAKNSGADRKAISSAQVQEYGQRNGSVA